MPTDFRTELEKTGRIVFTCKGVSMMPLLRQNKDIMVIGKAAPPYRRKDAVLFIRDNGQYVMHRITKVLDGKRYCITGDNCFAGETVREEQIIGILKEVHRNGRAVRVTDPGYRLYVLAVPLLRGVKKLRRAGGRVLRKLHLKQ